MARSRWPGPFGGIAHHRQVDGIIYWFQRLEPYTHSTWTQPLYDCPGYFFDRSKLPFSMQQQNAQDYGEYSYNAYGAPVTQPVPPIGILGLGLLDLEAGNVNESVVQVPADMMEIGDAYSDLVDGTSLDPGLAQMQGFQYGDDGMKQRARAVTRNRHTGVLNVLFCDGHVEHLKPSKLYGQGGDALQRLNIDHQPHSEILQRSVWPIISD